MLVLSPAITANKAVFPIYDRRAASIPHTAPSPAHRAGTGLRPELFWKYLGNVPQILIGLFNFWVEKDWLAGSAQCGGQAEAVRGV